MRILFITTHINTGGITSYLFTLAKGLLDKGNEVFIVSSGGDMDARFCEVGAKTFTLNIKTKSEISWKVCSNIIPVIKIINDNGIDIIHSHTRVTQVLSTIVSKFSKVKHIATCHGFFKTRMSRRIFPCWGEKTIAISSQVKEHLIQDFKVPEKNIALIESGVDIEQFNPSSKDDIENVKKELGIDSGKTIGIIARLSDVKGQDILISAMKKVSEVMPDVKLVIVGEGKMESQLRSLARELELDNKVVFIPIVNRSAEILPVFDVFVMPSRQEGLGLSIMEAQAAGVPVIGSRVGGIPTLISDGKTGYLVEPEDSNALADKIIYVLNNKQEADAVGKNGRKFISENFSSDQMTNNTIKVYESLINGK